MLCTSKVAVPFWNLDFIKITETIYLKKKNDTQMWKLHRKLNFPNIFRLAAIYTWAPAFKGIMHFHFLTYIATP